jgi:hypothetical protein
MGRVDHLALPRLGHPDEQRVEVALSLGVKIHLWFFYDQRSNWPTELPQGIEDANN